MNSDSQNMVILLRLCIADYTTQSAKLVITKDLKISEKKGNTKVAVPKDVSLCPT